ncbi:MAG: hypothetical protein L0387_09425 [Acidobacteria bacterium]|nr:hypothetical protein [Nitrospiraceae bacterium]MCI0621875.1 hypothetical protein [Acidobacteriota bacterium]MCI0720577.1 hypothetical protein [Acidobacteriota bacterium]
MGRLVHTTKVRIVQDQPPARRAYVEDFSQPIPFGVHGKIAEFYKLPKEKVTDPQPATLDYLVASVAG